MGYVRRSDRSSGLTRRRGADAAKKSNEAALGARRCDAEQYSLLKNIVNRKKAKKYEKTSVCACVRQDVTLVRALPDLSSTRAA
jgi:hypothetical protein